MFGLCLIMFYFLKEAEERRIKCTVKPFWHQTAAQTNQRQARHARRQGDTAARGRRARGRRGKPRATRSGPAQHPEPARRVWCPARRH